MALPIFTQDQINKSVSAGREYASEKASSLYSSAQASANSQLQSYGLPSLPSFGDTPIGVGDSLKNSQSNGNSFKVRLVSVLSMNSNIPSEIKQAAFDVTPNLNENRTVEYTAVQPVHMPGGIQVYKFTGSRVFELTTHLISRSPADALKNMQMLQLLRSWTMPFFGIASAKFGSSNNDSTAQKLPATNFVPYQDANETFNNQASAIQGGGTNGDVNLLGAPPEVLYLYGYSTSQNDGRQTGNVNINRIPVVLTSLGITYPEDVDYIPVSSSVDGKTEPFPVKMDVAISLTETHSPVEYERFDLMSFKKGTLVNF